MNGHCASPDLRGLPPFALITLKCPFVYATEKDREKERRREERDESGRSGSLARGGSLNLPLSRGRGALPVARRLHSSTIKCVARELYYVMAFVMVPTIFPPGDSLLIVFTSELKWVRRFGMRYNAARMTRCKAIYFNTCSVMMASNFACISQSVRVIELNSLWLSADFQIFRNTIGWISFIGRLKIILRNFLLEKEF